MIELSSKQCDAYMKKYRRLATGCILPLEDKWWVHSHGQRDYAYGNSREEAITRHRDKFNRDWTPPEIHDAEWALRYVEEQNLCAAYRPNNMKSRAWTVHARPPNSFKSAQGTSLLDAVNKWQAAYAPDPPEPTREEQGMELLMEVYEHFRKTTSYSQRLAQKIGEFCNPRGGRR